MFNWRILLTIIAESNPRMKINPLSVVKHSGIYVWKAATTWKHTEGHDTNQNTVGNEWATGITLY